MTRDCRWRRRLSRDFAAVVFVVLPALPAGEQAPRDLQVTFTKDIAPILQRSCQRCHRPDSVAPMSLITYEEVRPWARAIKQRTGLRTKPEAMPPWYIEKDIGIQQFKDDFSLNDEEIAKIARWVDSGAPKGDPAAMPPAVKFPEGLGWQLGTPDLIVSSPTVEMPAVGPDWWGAIRDTPTGLTEDRYVAWVEAREVNDAKPKRDGRTVGGTSIVHHLVYATVSPEAEKKLGRNLLVQDPSRRAGREAAAGFSRWPAHSVGRNGDVFPFEAAPLLKAGSKMVFPSAHLHAIGTPTKARLEVGFKFHPKDYKPTKQLVGEFGGAVRDDLDIRGGEANQKFEAFSTLPEHTKMVSFEPHMHAAGVRMCLEAIWGTYVETLNCAGYNHGWVRLYSYADDAAPLLPKGTILRLTAYFDTTPANKNVSDPRNWQGMGHRSIDNMMFNLGQGYYLTDEEFEQEMAKRRERLHLTEGQSVIGCPLCGYGKPLAATATQQQP